MNLFRNFGFSLAALLAFLPLQLCAWGPDGHRIIGALALDLLEPEVRRELLEVMGTQDLEELVQWCNWPDAFRYEAGGEWSYPEHYINMVPGAREYYGPRDCPTGMCVTEVIPIYAGQLANPRLDNEMRKKAFARVCHYVGDLHQPLHAGFGHDRGGNDFAIRYRGEESDIHTFWDHTLIEEDPRNWQQFYQDLRGDSAGVPAKPWKPGDVVKWTNESHAFAETHSYPENPDITDEFAAQSREYILQQLNRGGSRLAWVLNTVISHQVETPEQD